MTGVSAARSAADHTLLGIGHQLRTIRRSGGRLAGIGLVVTTILHGLAALIAAAWSPVMTEALTASDPARIVTGAWIALALLPALGGSDSDDPVALAALPATRMFLLGTRLTAGALDVTAAVLVPVVVCLSAALGGWTGWAAGVVLAVSALVCGQLASAVGARLSMRAGPTRATVVLTAGVCAALLALRGAQTGPVAWWQTAVDDLRWNVPGVAVMALGAVALWLLIAVPRAQPAALRSREVPRWPFVALVWAMAAGVTRSVVGRSAVASAALVPLLVSTVGVLDAVPTGVFVCVAAAAMIGANGFAYDAGGAVLWLSQRSVAVLLTARLAVTAGWALLTALLAVLACAALGAPVDVAELWRIAAAACVAGAAGLTSSVRRAAPAEVDSFRAQPAPPASAAVVTVKASALACLVVAAPAGLALTVCALYLPAALWRACRAGRDPVALSALA